MVIETDIAEIVYDPKVLAILRRPDRREFLDAMYAEERRRLEASQEKQEAELEAELEAEREAERKKLDRKRRKRLRILNSCRVRTRIPGGRAAVADGLAYIRKSLLAAQSRYRKSLPKKHEIETIKATKWRKVCQAKEAEFRETGPVDEFLQKHLSRMSGVHDSQLCHDEDEGRIESLERLGWLGY